MSPSAIDTEWYHDMDLAWARLLRLEAELRCTTPGEDEHGRLTYLRDHTQRRIAERDPGRLDAARLRAELARIERDLRQCDTSRSAARQNPGDVAYRDRLSRLERSLRARLRALEAPGTAQPSAAAGGRT